MRKHILVTIAVVFLPLLCIAQPTKQPTIAIDGRAVTVAICVNSSKTIWFALPPASGLAVLEFDTAATVNPPDFVRMMIMLKSDSASDSTRLLLHGLDENCLLIDNEDDKYLYGGASTFGSVFSNNVKIFALANIEDIYVFKLTLTNGDFTVGNRVYEVKLFLRR